MFQSFFPKPKLFFLSGLGFAIASMVIWYFLSRQIGAFIGLPFPAPEETTLSNLGFFLTNNKLTYYLYFGLMLALWFGFWAIFSPHKWQRWSILGSAIIIFLSYISAQAGVAINQWYGDFYNLIQKALTTKDTVSEGEFYALLSHVLPMAAILMILGAANSFFTKHYVFRWRTAMNEYYASKWGKLRHIEGASQRVQEDTMRFAAVAEPVGEAAIGSIMTLFAFLPLLAGMSALVTSIPILGKIPYALMFCAILWPIFGTALTFFGGIKLPGLEFKNQRVEAAYRKELVLGEDSDVRATPPTLRELFGHVRQNYFKLYFHYFYFDIIRGLYNQANTFFFWFMMVPTLALKAVTFGQYQQISNAFSKVSQSFLYLYRAWPSIIELMSIHKRLAAFEAAIDGQELPKIDQDYLEQSR